MQALVILIHKYLAYIYINIYNLVMQVVVAKLVYKSLTMVKDLWLVLFSNAYNA